MSCELGSWKVDIWYLPRGQRRERGWLAEGEVRDKNKLGGFPVPGTQPYPRARLQPSVPTPFSTPVAASFDSPFLLRSPLGWNEGGCVTCT